MQGVSGSSPLGSIKFSEIFGLLFNTISAKSSVELTCSIFEEFACCMVMQRINSSILLGSIRFSGI